jgi:hypothetical protein
MNDEQWVEIVDERVTDDWESFKKGKLGSFLEGATHPLFEPLDATDSFLCFDSTTWAFESPEIQIPISCSVGYGKNGKRTDHALDYITYALVHLHISRFFPDLHISERNLGSLSAPCSAPAFNALFCSQILQQACQ